MLLLHKSATLLLQFQMEEKAVIGNFSIYITQQLPDNSMLHTTQFDLFVMPLSHASSP